MLRKYSSYAYHGDSGTIVHNSKHIKTETKFSKGDRAGAGIILPQRHIFFTHNGEMIGKFYDLSEESEDSCILYPVVGCSAPCTIETNLGQTPFVFDISSLQLDEAVPKREEYVDDSLLFNDGPLSPTGDNPIDNLIECIQLQNMEQFSSILSDISDINALSTIGKTALHAACEVLGNDEIITMLLDAGANSSLHLEKYGTPLHSACYKGNVTAVNLLIHRGADIMATHKKKTACDCAFNILEIRNIPKIQDEVSNRISIIKTLEEMGCDMSLHTAVL